MDLSAYHFTINPVGLTGAAARHYVSQVHEHLRWIYRTTSGRILLNVIRRPDFPVEIRPHHNADCDARGGGEYKTPGAAPSGVVTYTPGTFGLHGSCAAEHGSDRAGRLFDEALFHELVHVFRNATRRWNNDPLLGWGMRQYDSNEEFIAVLVTNIYISDRTNKIKTGLRSGHQGFTSMKAEDAMRFGFFMSSATALPLLKQFCLDNPIFTKALSDKLADVEYNPIADFYRWPRLCEAFSILGQFNDIRKFQEALRAQGVLATVIEQLTKQVQFPKFK